MRVGLLTSFVSQVPSVLTVVFQSDFLGSPLWCKVTCLGTPLLDYEWPIYKVSYVSCYKLENLFLPFLSAA